MKHLQSAEKKSESSWVQNSSMYWKRQLCLERATKILFSVGYDLVILYFCEEGWQSASCRSTKGNFWCLIDLESQLLILQSSWMSAHQVSFAVKCGKMMRKYLNISKSSEYFFKIYLSVSTFLLSSVCENLHNPKFYFVFSSHSSFLSLCMTYIFIYTHI